ncbi:MAG: arginine N-succinyltransferase [Pseudomonadota bacterium]
MLVVRAARQSDHDAFVELASAAGSGFTSLAVSAEALDEKLAKSEAAFEGRITDPGDAVYQLMIEDEDSGEILGTAAVKAQIGVKKPYFDFKIMTLAQASREADRRFDMNVMLLVNDFAGCTEVGSLFVRDKARGTGAGRLIAQSRYLLIAAARERFGDRLISELRGVVSDDGSSPFFEHVTRPFFHMSFDEADRLSASTDNQFILDLMPVHPIYLELLPEAARNVVGKTHPHGVGAHKLLEWEGFEYDRYVDIFDGGPLVSCRTDKVRTLRESHLAPVGELSAAAPYKAIISNNRLPDFRVAFADLQIGQGGCGADEKVRRVLNLNAGDTARYWVKS